MTSQKVVALLVFFMILAITTYITNQLILVGFVGIAFWTMLFGIVSAIVNFNWSLRNAG